MDSNENSRPTSIQYSIWDTNKNNVKPIVPKKLPQQEPKDTIKSRKTYGKNKKVT